MRKVKTSSGKIVKKKKKGKGKKISMAGKTAGLISVSILFQTRKRRENFSLGHEIGTCCGAERGKPSKILF